MHRKQKINKGREDTQILTWKPKCGKNHDSPHAAEYTMREKYNNGRTQRQRPLSPLFRRTAVTMRQQPLSLSLSHSLYSYALCTYNYKSVQQQQTVFALSHIYTHMTFGLFTHMAPRGSLGHIHECVSPKPVRRSPPSLRSSGSP